MSARDITHLALSARDPECSARFYLEVIGLAGRAEAEEWGVLVTTEGGFALALIRGEPLPAEAIGRVHFGCSLPDPGTARATHDRLRRLGLEVEWEEEPGYASVKVHDPDGYVVELAYDGP